MNGVLPRIVVIGGTEFLVFLDTNGQMQMIAMDRLDGIAPNYKRIGASVVFIGTDERTNDNPRAIPADHPPEAFLALGFTIK